MLRDDIYICEYAPPWRGEHIHKSHNKSLLLYHFVCPIKYRRKVLSAEVSITFKEICLGIEERYERQPPLGLQCSKILRK